MHPTTQRRPLAFPLTTLALATISLATTQVNARQDVAFMTPIEGGGNATFQLLEDAEQRQGYLDWLEHPAAQLALDLYTKAHKAARHPDSASLSRTYYIALVPQGNFAAVGFELKSAAGDSSHPTQPYIKLDPSERSFATTFLHETGHVMLATLGGGRRVPAAPVASIPHSTAALTNRGTAFNEGFGIHLETIAGHFMTEDDFVRDEYILDRYDFGSDRMRTSEYLRNVVDMRNYAQTRSRYEDVRGNHFAFAAAHKGPDYLRVQLDKSRDMATLRDANQLLQSEGFYATFLFACMVRGDQPDDSQLAARFDRPLTVLAEIFATHPVDPHAAWLPLIVDTWIDLYPDDAAEIINILLDLSHGVFVDPEAQDLWRRTYRAALTLDIAGFPPPELHERRAAWRENVLDDPQLLYSRLGPQLPCMVKGPTVLLVAFGQEAPVSFDLNTVQEGIMWLIPEMTEASVATWIEERCARPFASVQDFKSRVGPGPFLSHLEYPGTSDSRP